MKKSLSTYLRLIAGTLAAFVLVFALAACGSSANTGTEADGSAAPSAELEKIVVGASPTPHAEILAAIADELANAGYELEVVEYSDYVQPNVALSEGELDANYFQHQPYLDDYNAENGTDLVGAVPVHFEPMSAYSNKHDSIDDVPDGAIIAVPSDATNEARALLLLEASGIITLEEGVGLEATPINIVDNPHNVEIQELEAAQVARALDDVDFAVINGNYALSAGLDTTATLASEATDSEAAQTYANVIAVRNGEENSAKIQALIDAITSATAKDFITETYDGVVVAVF